ncbi:unnamed protein product [Amoebophrya sp. A120]|nr:unnamed protein product [Amoebophrya sp. A120]|eukprot:GSA120T00000561001.1
MEPLEALGEIREIKDLGTYVWEPENAVGAEITSENLRRCVYMNPIGDGVGDRVRNLWGRDFEGRVRRHDPPLQTFPQLPNDYKRTEFPFTCPRVIPLYVAEKRGVDLATIDFMLGGSFFHACLPGGALTGALSGGHKRDLHTYIVENCKQVLVINKKERETESPQLENRIFPQYQFKRWVCGHEMDSEHPNFIMEHLRLAKIGKFRVLLCASVDALHSCTAPGKNGEVKVCQDVRCRKDPECGRPVKIRMRHLERNTVAELLFQMFSTGAAYMIHAQTAYNKGKGKGKGRTAPVIAASSRLRPRTMFQRFQFDDGKPTRFGQKITGNEQERDAIQAAQLSLEVQLRHAMRYANSVLSQLKMANLEENMTYQICCSSIDRATFAEDVGNIDDSPARDDLIEPTVRLRPIQISPPLLPPAAVVDDLFTLEETFERLWPRIRSLRLSFPLNDFPSIKDFVKRCMQNWENSSSGRGRLHARPGRQLHGEAFAAIADELRSCSSFVEDHEAVDEVDQDHARIKNRMEHYAVDENAHLWRERDSGVSSQAGETTAYSDCRSAVTHETASSLAINEESRVRLEKIRLLMDSIPKVRRMSKTWLYWRLIQQYDAHYKDWKARLPPPLDDLRVANEKNDFQFWDDFLGLLHFSHNQMKHLGDEIRHRPSEVERAAETYLAEQVAHREVAELEMRSKGYTAALMQVLLDKFPALPHHVAAVRSEAHQWTKAGPEATELLALGDKRDYTEGRGALGHAVVESFAWAITSSSADGGKKMLPPSEQERQGVRQILSKARELVAEVPVHNFTQWRGLDGKDALERAEEFIEAQLSAAEAVSSTWPSSEWMACVYEPLADSVPSTVLRPPGPLHRAVAACDLEGVRKLLQAGVLDKWQAKGTEQTAGELAMANWLHSNTEHAEGAVMYEISRALNGPGKNFSSDEEEFYDVASPSPSHFVDPLSSGGVFVLSATTSDDAEKTVNPSLL